MKLRVFSFIGCVILSFVLVLNSSCEKQTDCKANITVTDSTGGGAGNIPVLLFATVKTANNNTVTADLKAEGVTDGSGQVSFTFKLPAIYDIRATKTVGSKTLVATGIIKLEEGKGVDKTVNLK
jgi:hypothetical protein